MNCKFPIEFKISTSCFEQETFAVSFLPIKNSENIPLDFFNVPQLTEKW